MKILLTISLSLILGACATTREYPSRQCTVVSDTQIKCTINGALREDFVVYHPEYNEPCTYHEYKNLGKMYMCVEGYTFIPDGTCRMDHLPDFGVLITCSDYTQILIDRRYKKPASNFNDL